MPRPNRSKEQTREFIPIIARAFVELGYRRATTAELARRCGVQENILYRLWSDKKGMFIASIEYIYDMSTGIWEKLLIDNGDGRSTAQRLLEYEAKHHGEYGMYRIVFTGLSETDDPEITAALCRMYSRYHSFLVRRIVEHRPTNSNPATAELDAWALIGLSTITVIGRELQLLNTNDRQQLWEKTGNQLLQGQNP